MVEGGGFVLLMDHGAFVIVDNASGGHPAMTSSFRAATRFRTEALAKKYARRFVKGQGVVLRVYGTEVARWAGVS